MADAGTTQSLPAEELDRELAEIAKRFAVAATNEEAGAPPPKVLDPLFEELGLFARALEEHEAPNDAAVQAALRALGSQEALRVWAELYRSSPERKAELQAARPEFLGGGASALSALQRLGFLSAPARPVDLRRVLAALWVSGSADEPVLYPRRWVLAQELGFGPADPVRAFPIEAGEELLDDVTLRQMGLGDAQIKGLQEVKACLNVARDSDGLAVRHAFWDAAALAVASAKPMRPESIAGRTEGEFANLGTNSFRDLASFVAVLAKERPPRLFHERTGVLSLTMARALLCAQLAYGINEDVLANLDAEARALAAERGGDPNGAFAGAYAALVAQAEVKLCSQIEAKRLEIFGALLVAADDFEVQRVFLACGDGSVHDASATFAPSVLIYCRSADTYFLASRGTRSPFGYFREWVRDVQKTLEHERQDKVFGGCFMHRGFRKCYKWQEAAVVELLGRGELRAKRLVVTGHSLGGAVAQLLAAAVGAARLEAGVDQDVATPLLVTFGAPHVGDAALQAATARRTHFIRVWARGDPVAVIPYAEARAEAGQRYARHGSTAHVRLAYGKAAEVLGEEEDPEFLLGLILRFSSHRLVNYASRLMDHILLFKPKGQTQ